MHKWVWVCVDVCGCVGVGVWVCGCAWVHAHVSVGVHGCVYSVQIVAFTDPDHLYVRTYVDIREQQAFLADLEVPFARELWFDRSSQ